MAELYKYSTLLFALFTFFLTFILCPCSLADDLTYEVLMNKGIDMMRRGRFEGALDCFENALEKSPEDERLYCLKVPVILNLASMMMLLFI